MIIRFSALTSIIALACTACATHQENPHYQYSTQHNQTATQAQTVASSQTLTTTPTASYQTIQSEPQYSNVHQASVTMGSVVDANGLKAEGCEVEGGSTAAQLQPTSYLTQASSTTQTAPMTLPGADYVAPTDMAYGDVEDSHGTPGYHAVRNSLMEEEEEFAPSPYQVTPTSSVVQLGTAYEIMPGDTVYSLSRRLCVGVKDIQELNGLDQAYKIHLGDNIMLPPSQC